jgi:predicted flap endonuclease-1-like 5' DNA nuclease
VTDAVLLVAGLAIGVVLGWFAWGRRRAEMTRELAEMRTRLTSIDMDRQRLLERQQATHYQLEVLQNELKAIRRAPRAPSPPPPAHEMMVVLQELEVDERLQNIKGVGPKLALMLAAEGITSLSRLANLTEEALDHLSVRIPAVAERARREGWREQARDLLASTSQSQQITNHASGGPPEDLTIELKEPDPAVTPEL